MFWILTLSFCIFFGFEYWFSNTIKLLWLIFNLLYDWYWLRYITLSSNTFHLLVSLYTFTVYFHFKILPSIVVFKCFFTQFFLFPVSYRAQLDLRFDGCLSFVVVKQCWDCVIFQQFSWRLIKKLLKKSKRCLRYKSLLNLWLKVLLNG